MSYLNNHFVDQVLGSIASTRDRGLSIRTYQVVPLSPVVGLVQWVTGTVTLGEFVIGKSKGAKAKHRSRYFPQDISNETARDYLSNARDPSKPQLNGNGSAQLKTRLLHAYRSICDRFHPIMDLRLMESFPSSHSW